MTVQYMLISCCLMYLAAGQDLASQIRRGTRHRQGLDRTGNFVALSESSQPVNNQFIRTYSSCQAPLHKCLLVHFQFDCDLTVCRVVPVQLKAAYINAHNQTQPTSHHSSTDLRTQSESERKLEEIVSEESKNDAADDNVFTLALTQICQKLGLNCTAKSIPIIGPFIEGFVQSGGANFLPKIPTVPDDPQGDATTTRDADTTEEQVITESESQGQDDDDELRAAAARLAQSKIRSGSVKVPLHEQRMLSGESDLYGPLMNILRWAEEESNLTPLTPLGSFKLDNNGAVNPFLSNLPTLRPPPISMRAEDVPFDNWLSRVKLPVNVRAATSGMELFRAVESKTLELFLSMARVPLAVTANAFGTPPSLPTPPRLPVVLDQTKLNQEYDALDLLTRLQAQSFMRNPLPPSESNNKIRQLQSDTKRTQLHNLRQTTDETSPPKQLQQLEAIDSIMGLFSSFLPGGGALQSNSLITDDSYLDELDPLANAVSTSDLLPWLPVDSVAATLPSWLIKSLMGPYALLFEDFVRVAQDGFIRMQLVFDTFADEPIPVTARGIEQFSEQMAEAFRATPAGDEADALKSIALTVRQLPTFMPHRDETRETEGRHQSPLLDVYDDWVKQVTRNRRLIMNEGISTRKLAAVPNSIPPKTVVLLSERTTSDNLPWLPMDEVVGGLPSFYLDKLGKPGKALKKVAGAWLSGAEKVDKAAKTVLDPILSLTGDLKKSDQKESSSSSWTSGRSTSDWSGDEWNNDPMSSSGWNDDSGQGRDRSSSSSNSDPDSSDNNILDTVGNLISGLLGQRTSLFLQAEQELETARLGILEGMHVGPLVLNDATLSLVSTVPDILLSIYNPFPNAQTPEQTQRSVEQFFENLGPDTETAQDALTDLQEEIDQAFRIQALEIQNLFKRVQQSLPTPISEEETSKAPLPPNPVQLPNLFESSPNLPNLLDSTVKTQRMPFENLFENLGLDKPIVLPSLEELDEALRVAQESFERTLLQLGLLPIRLDGQLFPSYLVGTDSPFRQFLSHLSGTPSTQDEKSSAKDMSAQGETLSAQDETKIGAEETALNEKKTSLRGEQTSSTGEETSGEVAVSRETTSRRSAAIGKSFIEPTGSLLESNEESKDFMQMSGLTELYDESFAMYERAVQDRWRFIRDYNQLLFKAAQTPPILPAQLPISSITPFDFSPRRSGTGSETSTSAVSSTSIANGAPVLSESHGEQPRQSVDGLAALLGSLIDSVTYTGGEMLGTLAHRFVPASGLDSALSPQGGFLSPQIDLLSPQVKGEPSRSIMKEEPKDDGPKNSPGEIEELTAKLKDALVRANELIAITERLDRLMADSTPRRLSQERANMSDRRRTTDWAKRDVLTKETYGGEARRLEGKLDPIFIKPEGVGEEENLTPSQLLIGLLEAANRSNYNRMNKVVMEPMKFSIPPELDFRIRLVDIHERMRNNEQYGNIGLMMNQDLQSFTNWALARNLINRKERKLEEARVNTRGDTGSRADVKTQGDTETRRDTQNRGDIKIVEDNETQSQGGNANIKADLERNRDMALQEKVDTTSKAATDEEMQDLATEGPMETATKTRGDTTEEGQSVSWHFEGLFDTLFELISEGVSDLSRSAGDPKAAAKNSAASLIRSISDQIVSSGPKIKDEPEGAADQMEEKRPHRGEKCVNNANCRLSHGHVYSNRYGARSDGRRPPSDSQPARPTPQGSVILNPHEPGDEYFTPADQNAFSRRPYY